MKDYSKIREQYVSVFAYDTPVSFEEETHTYTLNGKELTPVTKFLQQIKVAPDYSGIDEDLLMRRAQYGKEVHKEIEEWIKFGKVGNSFEFNMFIDFLTKHDCFTIVASELLVYDNNYAGTLDLLLYDRDTFDYIVVDIKTTSVIHNESVKWQDSCYQHLLKNAYGINAKRIGVLHLTANDSEYKELTPIKEEQVVYAMNNYSLPTISGVDDMAMVEVTKALKWIAEYKKYISGYQTFIDQFLDKFKDKMEEQSVKKFENDDFKITYVEGSERKSIDSKALKQDYPEIYEKYLKTTKVKPYLKIELKEKENQDNGEEEN